MPLEQLRQLLQDLRRELEMAEDLRDALRSELMEAIRAVEDAIAGPNGALKQARDRLAQRMIGLESEHPEIGALTDRVMRQLSRMGI